MSKSCQENQRQIRWLCETNENKLVDMIFVFLHQTKSDSFLIFVTMKKHPQKIPTAFYLQCLPTPSSFLKAFSIKCPN